MFSDQVLSDRALTPKRQRIHVSPVIESFKLESVLIETAETSPFPKWLLHAKSMINIAQCKLIKWRQTLLLHVSDLPRCFRKFFVKEKRPTRLGVALFFSFFLQSWLWKLYYKLMIIKSLIQLNVWRPPLLWRVAEVYETFQLFDDGTGCIQQSDFEVIIKAMGGLLTAGEYQ